MKQIIRVNQFHSTPETIQNLKFWNQRPVEALNEMAVYLKDFCKRVDGLRFQLVENWCLCMYCSLYDKENINFKHWKEELFACMSNIQRVDIKNGIDKHKTLEKMLIGDYDYNKTKKIYYIAREKFIKEKLPLDKLETSAKEMTLDMNSILNVLSYEAEYPIIEYINKTFK